MLDEKESKWEALYHLVLLKRGFDNQWLKRHFNNIFRGSFEKVWTGVLDRSPIIPKDGKVFLEMQHPGFRKAIESIAATDFQAIRISDPEFPDVLRRGESDVPVIYAQGNLELLYEKTMALKAPYDAKRIFDGDRHIGDTRPTWDEFTKSVIDSTIELVKDGFTLVAEVYGDAHRIAINTALKYGEGRVIGVVKGGLDGAGKRELNARVAREGLLVSDMPVGMKYLYEHFEEFNHKRIFTNLEKHLASFGTIMLYEVERQD